MTDLKIAIINQDRAAIFRLLQDVAPTYRYPGSRSILYYGLKTQSLAVMTALLDGGVDYYHFTANDNDLWTLKRLCPNYLPVLDLLISYGFDLNRIQTPKGQSQRCCLLNALHIVDLKMFQALLDRGANLDLQLQQANTRMSVREIICTYRGRKGESRIVHRFRELVA